MTLARLTAASATWLEQIRADAPVCEARRPFTRRPSKTGTISEAAALYLRAWVEHLRPRVCIEIGTFIGTSALVLASTGATVFTCDKDNDVLPSTDRVIAYGRTGSTAMLTALLQARVEADCWFFDGRIQDADLPLIRRLSAPGAVYAFDDYEDREKGVINVEKLKPQLRGYRLIPPPSAVIDLPSRTTIAVLAPEAAR